MPVLPKQLSELQAHPEWVRNICILAHVDHGKTTLSDMIISSNGIISAKMAGELRYLDSREDEQLRCITMKSSSIALLHEKNDGDSTAQYLVNLVDTPGHIDFSSEASTAVRVSDGALVVVDVLEGVCIQTHAVLRQAFNEQVRPCLVLNKIDRMIVELQLSPEEIHDQLKRIIEQVNVVWSTLHRGDIMQEATNAWDQARRQRTSSAAEDDTAFADMGELEDDDFDPEIEFSPAHGNVVFASAIDGWAFGIEQFAQMYAKKLNVQASILQRTLWGEYYFDPKSKKIMKQNPTGRLKPMFVQFALQSLWQVYDAIVMNNDPAKIEKIVSSLGLTVNKRDLNHKDTRHVLRAVSRQWLPAARAILDMVVTQLPSPLEAQTYRVPKLWAKNFSEGEKCPEVKEVCNAAMQCKKDGPVVVYISKMISNASETSTDKDKDFIAFARVLSGTLRAGSQVYVLQPRFNPAEPEKHCSAVTIDKLYMMMGRGLEELDEVPAGNVLGIGGLGGVVLKTATLSSSLACHPVSAMVFEASPIVRVALESKIPTEMGQLVEGLKQLNQADPSVEIILQETGEHVIATCGEVHLERCLKDLRELFARVEMIVSPPIVSFRETIVECEPSEVPEPTEMTSRNGQCTVTFRTVPLPQSITDFLEENIEVSRAVFDRSIEADPSEEKFFFEKAKEIFVQAGPSWEADFDIVCSLGPRRIGSNILIVRVPDFVKNAAFRPCFTHDAREIEHVEDEQILLKRDIGSSILTGFQLATSSGPLCEEPLAGVCFVVESIEINDVPQDELDNHGPISGQIISVAKEGFRKALLSNPMRLLEPVYLCQMHATSEVLGKMYGVLSKRRGQVLLEDMKEGTNYFFIEGELPVVESFGFAEDLRKKTSGAASPQLKFSRWQLIVQDPFWVPKTDEELEEFGEKGDAPLFARKLVDDVRRRKGLHVEEHIVEHAEKQRTVSRKK